MSRDALVVGINTYKSLTNLHAPARDAEAIAQRLHTDGEFRVHRLPEVVQSGSPQVGQKTALTLRELETALVNLFKPKDKAIPHTALFYFSGHGIQREAGIQEGFLALSDSNPEKGIFGLSLFWLRRLLQESPVKQRIIILDCCHSGEFLNFLEADPGACSGTDRLFMAASRAHESAYESLKSPYSVFTQAILTGLDPRRVESGIVTNHSLTDWVNHQLKGEIQQPLFESSGSEIILTRCSNSQPLLPMQPSAICPYRGSTCFGESHSDYFFGREDATAELMEKLNRDRLIVVTGASGSGKSSLVRAGLIASLKQRSVQQWQIKLLTPGEHPLKSLASAFIDSSALNLDRAEQLRRAETFLQAEGGLAQLVQASLPLEDSVGGSIEPPQHMSRRRMLLIIDQFEEVFTRIQGSHAEQERQQFFICLTKALEIAGNYLSIVIVLRSDFLTKFSCCSGWRQTEQHRVEVQPLPHEQLRSIVLKPAQKAKLTCEPGFVHAMLFDVVGAPGELSLVQAMLLKLWKQQAGSSARRLTLDMYQQLGGICGMLQERATSVFNDLSEQEQPVAKRIFLALTQLGEGTEDTRRRVMKLELVSSTFPIEVVDPVLEKLAVARLIVTSYEPKRSPLQPRLTQTFEANYTSAASEMVDVAHETLIRSWSLLRSWLEESRDMLRRMRRIEQAAQEWHHANQPLSEYLLQGLRLRDAEDFQRTHPDQLSALAQHYVVLSHEEACRTRRKSQQLRIAVPSVLLMALVVGLSQYRNAVHSQVEQEYQLTSSQERAAIAQTILREINDDPMTALRVGPLAASSSNGSYEAQLSLRTALQDLRLQVELRGHEGAVHQLAFSPDQSYLATAGADSTIRLWTIGSHTIFNKSLSPARTLAWATVDSENKRTEQTGLEKPAIAAITFSRDGKQLAAIATTSPLVKVWSVETGSVMLQLAGSAVATQVMFSPDGNWIVAAQSDRTLSVWNLHTGQLQARSSQAADVTNLQFSPDGQLLLVSSGSTVQVLRLALSSAQRSLQPVATLRHPGSIADAQFSPRSDLIATAAEDGVRLWSAAGQLRQTLPRTTAQSLSRIQFSPDGSLLAIANSRQVGLWNLQASQFQAQLPTAAPSRLLQFSPDGRSLMTSGSQGLVRSRTEPAPEVIYLWNAQTGQQIGRMQSQGVVEAAQFSLDGTYVATASGSGVVQLWSTQAGGELPTIDLPGTPIAWSMFLPPTTSTHSSSAIASRFVTMTPDGNLQNWQILTDAVPPAPKPANSTSTYSAVIDSQGVWQRLLKMGRLQPPRSAAPTPSLDSIGVTALPESTRADTALGSRLGASALSPDGQVLAVANSQGEVEIRPMQRGSTQIPLQIRNRRLLGQTASLSEVASLAEAPLNPRSAQVASANLMTLNQLSFSADGRLLMGVGDDLTIRLWDVQTGQLLKALQGHKTRVGQAHFSADGQWIVTASYDQTAQIWQTASGQSIQVLRHQATVNSASFSPDGQQVVTASSDGVASVWDVQTGQQRLLLSEHQAEVLDAQFSPDGRSIITTSADGTAILWNAQTGLMQAHLRPPTAGTPTPLVAAAFSPDGQYVTTQTQDGKLHLWAATWEMLLKLARDRSFHQFTPEECSHYFSLDSTCSTLPL